MGGCDFEKGDLQNIADMENDIFGDPGLEVAKDSGLCENAKILPRKNTKGTILVLKPEGSEFDSQGTMSNANDTLNNKMTLLSSQGADSAIMHEANYSAPDSARFVTGNKPGQTAFQRLVLASKRIIKERSSSKKKHELRSHSQNAQQIDMCLNGNGSASSKKLQTRNDEVGFYARPFSIMKERSQERSVTEPPGGEVQRFTTTEPPSAKPVHATAHTMASLRALADFTKKAELTQEIQETNTS